MNPEIVKFNEKIKEKSKFIDEIKEETSKVIVGQKYMIDRILTAILSDGHILIEGVPGLAKTLTVNTIAKSISADFKRIQFTPDLLPADLIGTLIYNQKTGNFTTKKGPVFTNIILADEINRAPAKVQSALLEAMQERQVTIGSETFPMEDFFLVLATENPIEQEGTYPLPEAQVDRFLFKLNVKYPKIDEEKEIVKRMTVGTAFAVKSRIKQKDIISARKLVQEIHIDEKIIDYIVDIVFSTREPEKFNLDIKELIAFGASPRASINLTIAAKANAFMNHRGYVIPEDVKLIGFDVLRHRILLTYEAEAENITSDDIIEKIFDTIEVP